MEIDKVVGNMIEIERIDNYSDGSFQSNIYLVLLGPQTVVIFLVMERLRQFSGLSAL